MSDYTADRIKKNWGDICLFLYKSCGDLTVDSVSKRVRIEYIEDEVEMYREYGSYNVCDIGGDLTGIKSRVSYYDFQKCNSKAGLAICKIFELLRNYEGILAVSEEDCRVTVSFYKDGHSNASSVQSFDPEEILKNIYDKNRYFEVSSHQQILDFHN